ncbi:TrkH-domain-containing protein [Phlegmacium glaucopus]|nr:TrkH-domain-containing protein [Phlegmacium glaucopus]
MPTFRIKHILDLRKHLNFYRIHILFFTFTPLIFSAIFYASNGKVKISYIDSLYNSVSAMTVTGLATVNLSSLTHWQQTILFLQMCLGSPVLVSLVMVFIRRYFFAKKFQHILETAAAKKAAGLTFQPAENHTKSFLKRLMVFLTGKPMIAVDADVVDEDLKKRKGRSIRRLTPHMIRRMDEPPRPINPSGNPSDWVSEHRPPPDSERPESPEEFPSNSQDCRRSVSLDIQSEKYVARLIATLYNTLKGRRRLSDPGPTFRTPSRIHQSGTEIETSTSYLKSFPRVHTVEFAPPPRRHAEPVIINDQLVYEEIRSRRPSVAASSIHTRANGRTHGTHPTTHLHHKRMNRDMGGFPMPWSIIGSLFTKLFPGLKRKITRTVTIPVTTSLTPGHENKPGSKHAPYLSFKARVGPNSTFHFLTSDQLDEIGGVEYRALNALLWIVAGYHIGIQLVAFTVIAPYMSINRWKPIFQTPVHLNSTWFSLFQVVSAYTNTGMSLVDQSMIPFQQAYPMIIFMILLILAGNTAFVSLSAGLFLSRWCISKVIRKASRLQETLQFLLAHPRRCFIYLFPSHQTWFLLTIVLGFTLIDWFFFLVLDIDNPVLDQIPVGVRVIDGLLQASCVRAAGFSVIPLSALAPAVKVLYVVTMYISVCTSCVSVRSTNVYEEQSLGVFHDEEEEAEEGFEISGPRMSVWSRYLAMHARRQLAFGKFSILFDMWWLALALFFSCIIERSKLENPDDFEWFNIFSIIFELVSAYGTVGLSLGIPDQNYSLSGEFAPLTKLIFCLVMIRGRHRGLPAAIDRAVMLPAELQETDDLIRGNKRQASADGDCRDAQVTSDGTSTPPCRPFLHSETMNSSNQASLVHQRSRTTLRRFSASKEELYDVAENGQASEHDRDGIIGRTA